MGVFTPGSRVLQPITRTLRLMMQALMREGLDALGVSRLAVGGVDVFPSYIL